MDKEYRSKPQHDPTAVHGQNGYCELRRRGPPFIVAHFVAALEQDVNVVLALNTIELRRAHNYNGRVEEDKEPRESVRVRPGPHLFFRRLRIQNFAVEGATAGSLRIRRRRRRR